MTTWQEVSRAVAKAAPVLSSVLGGPIGAVAGAAGSVLASVLGVKDDPDTVLEAVRNNPDIAVRLRELEVQEGQRLLEWREKQLEVEQKFENELSRRHKADMKSDSWLSKNVRPLCLLMYTVALVGGVFVGEVEAEKLSLLTELGMGVYGYYFMGRSVFDKGAVRVDWRRP